MGFLGFFSLFFLFLYIFWVLFSFPRKNLVSFFLYAGGNTFSITFSLLNPFYQKKKKKKNKPQSFWGSVHLRACWPSIIVWLPEQKLFRMTGSSIWLNFANICLSENVGFSEVSWRDTVYVFGASVISERHGESFQNKTGDNFLS